MIYHQHIIRCHSCFPDILVLHFARKQAAPSQSFGTPYTDSSTTEDVGINPLGILCRQLFINCCCLDSNENKTRKVLVFRLHVVTNISNAVESGLMQEGEHNGNLCLAGSAAHKQNMGKRHSRRNPTKSCYPGLENCLKREN